jgi:hypothetical protein
MAAWMVWRSLAFFLILGSAAALKLPFFPIKTTNSKAIGDNGKVTWNGRARESNTMTFGNELLLQQGLAAAADFMSNLVKGTVRTTNPIPKDTPKTEVNGVPRLCGEWNFRGHQPRRLSLSKIHMLQQFLQGTSATDGPS